MLAAGPKELAADVPGMHCPLGKKVLVEMPEAHWQTAAVNPLGKKVLVDMPEAHQQAVNVMGAHNLSMLEMDASTIAAVVS